jgi:hypothetical protein
MVQASDEPNLHRVDRHPEDDRNGRGRRLRRQRCGRAAGRNDHGHPAAYQIGSHLRQLIVARSPTIFDLDVPAFDIPGFAQPLPESCQPQILEFP